MKPLIVLALAAALSAPACLMTVDDDGLEWHSWDEFEDLVGDGFHGHGRGGETTCVVDGREVCVDGDVVRVDGVRLRHERWVGVSHAGAAGALFDVTVASGPVELHGVEGPAAFEVLLHSEHEGDGSVALEDGRLVAHGDRGEVFINGVRGCAPRGAALRVSTGTGVVELHGFAGPSLSVGSGTGPVRLHGCEPRTLAVDSGTGDVLVERGSAEEARLGSGTADITVRGARLASLQAASGTGDVRLDGCEIGRLHAESGTGDLVVSGGRVQQLHHQLGTGEVEITDGAEVGG
jgi:hypothetical protein